MTIDFNHHPALIVRRNLDAGGSPGAGEQSDLWHSNAGAKNLGFPRRWPWHPPLAVIIKQLRAMASPAEIGMSVFI